MIGEMVGEMVGERLRTVGAGQRCSWPAPVRHR
jgi:hypothetical protein